MNKNGILKIGIVGTGGMAHAHAKAYKEIKDVELSACCDVFPDRAKAFAETFGIPKVYTSYEEMFEKEELDGISNVTSDKFHAPVALAAAKHKVNILSEKPLATSLAEGKKMVAAVKKAKTINLVNFSYRNSCALQAAAQVVKEGKIGRVMHVEASYLQGWLVGQNWGDWKKSPGLLWRLSTAHGSLGDLGDIGVHIYDLVTLLAGDISEINATLRTFTKGVPGEQVDEYKLDANDSFVSTVTFAHGGLGTVHSSRWAVGQANSLRARVYGDQGSIIVDLDKSYSTYSICTGEDVHKAVWRDVEAPATPNMYERFIQSIRTGVNDPSDFANALKIQAYLHYSFESSKKRKPLAVKI